MSGHCIFRLIAHLAIFLLFLLILIVHQAAEGLSTENIVGGNVTSVKEFPYVVYVNGPGVANCSGALISASLVLTAGHCVYDEDMKNVAKSKFYIIAGTSDLHKKSKVLEVTEIYTHRYFQVLEDFTVLNDIAVLKMKESLKVSKGSAYSALELPKNYKEIYSGKTGLIAGFGYNKIATVYNEKTKENDEVGSSDGLLRSASVRILPFAECGETYQPMIFCGQVVQSPKGEKRGVCTGDSGSILVIDSKAVGILSTSPEGCNEKDESAGYMRVTLYMPFIESIMSGKLTDDVIKT